MNVILITSRRVIYKPVRNKNGFVLVTDLRQRKMKKNSNVTLFQKIKLETIAFLSKYRVS